MNRKHPLLVELGNNIRKARLSNGLPQEKLADLSGLDRTYIGGIERGERNVAVINLIRIANALNLDLTSLFPSAESIHKFFKEQ